MTDGMTLGVVEGRSVVGRMQPQKTGGVTLGLKLGRSDGEADGREETLGKLDGAEDGLAVGEDVSPGWHVPLPFSLMHSNPGQHSEGFLQDWSAHC